MRRREFIARSAAGSAAFLTLGSLPLSGCGAPRPVARALDHDWDFRLEGDAWDRVSLPHTAHVEAVVTGPPGSDTFQWQGRCEYRRVLRFDAEEAAAKVVLHLEGAMNNAEVLLDGEPLGVHRGGFLPFAFDLTDRVEAGRDHELLVRLDNTDDPVTGPKPLRDLDFNMYGGLYRRVHLTIQDRLHITDPILERIPGGGGIFVTYPEATQHRALVRIQTHVRNDHPVAKDVEIEHELFAPDGSLVATDSTVAHLRAHTHDHYTTDLTVINPALWDPDNPNIHRLATHLRSTGTSVATLLGLRRIEISPEGFRINGQRRFLRGTNRHQEYPHIGYALSDAAQYRDAKLIKDAGFDYIRLSHYPHATAFMAACDELGIVVMDCIPGWQYFNYDDPAFTEIQLENCRQMMRRDRNHPCVILWEVSLNETWMPEEFIEATKAAAAEEYPGDQCYTCGWQGSYDVFIQARQHGGCRGVTDRSCVVSEYGDWEYYAMNAGLNQADFQNLAPDDSNSRQLRWHGEAAMLQQAANFQEAHNDNRATIAFADGLWVMFDYNRGYAPDIESSGCADLFRIPKFSYHFFRSQRSPIGRDGAMVFIASYWTPQSGGQTRVFSNCDEVELLLNGRSVGRSGGDSGRTTTNLAHPPFTFDVEFEPATLEARGYVDGVVAARHEIRTPGPVRGLRIEWAEEGRPFGEDAVDVGFVRAVLTDEAGTTIPHAWENVAFGVAGPVAIVGGEVISSEAGIASAVVRGQGGPRAYAGAIALITGEDGIRVLHATGAPGGVAGPASEVRVTTDGSEPTTESALYDGGSLPGRVRAALVADGRVLAGIDSETPKTRPQGSVAPDSLGEFHY